jgi:hypothetical protein
MQREIALLTSPDYDQAMDLQPRPMPVETLSGLRPPLAGYPYFAHADQMPFQPRAVEHSEVNAWWLADASFLVYGTAAFVEQSLADSPLPAQGFHLEWLGTPDNNRGMVLTSETAIVVVFRGTRLQVHSLLDAAEVVLLNQDDLWIDGQFFPAGHRAGGKAHAGFMMAFAEVGDRLDAIVRARRPGQALWLAGHSLGGALATLAAAHMGREAVQGLYTYGGPRVGDSAFASVLPAASHHRFVHREDWVATLPPEFLGYVHAGIPHLVKGSPTRNVLDEFTAGLKELASALQSMAAESRFKADALPFRLSGLADHMPVYYATLLWNSLLATAAGR